MPFKTANQIVLKKDSGTPFITINYEEENGWVHLEWKGFLPVDLVKEGSEECLNSIKRIGNVNKVLSDIKNVTGPWSKANEWFDQDWNPRATAAGLKHMAVIVSPNIFSQLSLQGFVEVSNGFTVRSFQTEEKAREWLKSV